MGIKARLREPALRLARHALMRTRTNIVASQPFIPSLRLLLSLALVSVLASQLIQSRL